MKINAFFACTTIKSYGGGIADIGQAGTRTVFLNKFKKGATFKIILYCLLETEPNDVPGPQVARIQLIGADGPIGKAQDTPFTLTSDPGFVIPMTIEVPADGPISLNFSLSILGSNVAASWPLDIKSGG